MTASRFTLDQLAGNLELTVTEHADHLAILRRVGKRSPEELGIKEIRLAMLRETAVLFRAQVSA